MTEVRLDVWGILSRAVEEGLGYGITRVFKYDDRPVNEAALRAQQETLHRAVMMTISEVLAKDDPEEAA